MGNEILVYTQLGGKQVIARFSPEADVEIDAPAMLHFNLDKVQFFDPESEAIIK
jgi:multiple sugar transport system ATP-binding protein